MRDSACLEWEGKLQPEFCTTSTVMQLIQELGQAEASNQSLQHQLREAVEALEDAYEVIDGDYTDTLHSIEAVIESYRKMHG